MRPGLDSNVYLSGFVFGGKPKHVLEMAIDGKRTKGWAFHVFIDHDNGHRPYGALALTPPQPTRPACPNGAALASRVAIDLVV